MNAFAYALKMEQDGERYYREQALKTQYEELKVVLEGMAADELRHYQIIQALQNRKIEYVPGPEEMKITIQNVFEQAINKPFISKDQDSIAKFKDEQVDVYRAALLKEEESVQLYKKLQETAEQEAEKSVLGRLMQEEQNHVDVLENIIQMFNQMNEWVEAAEFNHQKPY